MPGGLDEAAAILTFVEVGFSVAKALKTYIENYRDAPSDVKQLARDLESAMGYVKELEAMLAENAKKTVLAPGALSEAQRCIHHANVVVKALVGLLSRGNKQEVSAEPLKPEDLDMSRLQQMTWPLQKNAFVKVKNELHSLTSKIMIFLALYASKASSSKFERDLYSTQALTVAFALEKAYRSRNVQRRRTHFDDIVRREEVPSLEVPLQPVADEDSDDDLSGAMDHTVATISNLEANVRQKMLDEGEQRKAAEQEKLRIEEESKAAYRQSLANQLAERKRKDAELKSHLHDMFGVLPEDQVKAFVSHQQRKEDIGDDIFQFISGIEETNDQPHSISDERPISIISVDNTRDGTRKGSGRLKRFFSFARKTPTTIKDDSDTVPLYLGFMVSLKEQTCIMTSVAVPYSLQKTLQKTFRKSGARYDHLMNTTLQAYRNVHPSIQQRLDDWLKAERSENERAWSLCHACTCFGHRARHPIWEALYGTATSDPRITALSAPTIDTENVLVVFRYLETVNQPRRAAVVHASNQGMGKDGSGAALARSEEGRSRHAHLRGSSGLAQQTYDQHTARQVRDSLPVDFGTAAMQHYGQQLEGSYYDGLQTHLKQRSGVDPYTSQHSGPRPVDAAMSTTQLHAQRSSTPQLRATQSSAALLPNTYGPSERPKASRDEQIRKLESDMKLLGDRVESHTSRHHRSARIARDRAGPGQSSRYYASSDDPVFGHHAEGAESLRPYTYVDQPLQGRSRSPPYARESEHRASAQRQYISRTSNLTHSRRRTATDNQPLDPLVEDDGRNSADENRDSNNPAERNSRYSSQVGDQYYDPVIEERHARTLRDLAEGKLHRPLQGDGGDVAGQWEADVGETVSEIVRSESTVGEEPSRWQHGKRTRQQEGSFPATQDGDLLQNPRNRALLHRLQERFTNDEFSGSPSASRATSRRQATVADQSEGEVASRWVPSHPGAASIGVFLSPPTSDFVVPNGYTARGVDANVARRDIQEPVDQAENVLPPQPGIESMSQQGRNDVAERGSHQNGYAEAQR
ncbi:hypothetical protein LTR27_009074 [Elasticomyces elasticus]|nr:hypothetical protein LTR27_009074 [Elasticomyces elasticus]